LGDEKSGWVDTKNTVAFLRDRRSYPEDPGTIEVIETHKSWVFLMDTLAYKLKKPIRYDSVDFQSLQTRCANCTAEVNLNRRLAGDVYIGVEQVTADQYGDLELGGDGSLVDCLVKMKRLPAGRMLSTLIREHRIEDDEIRRLGNKLARFYRDSPPALNDPGAYRQHLLDEMHANLAGLSEPDRGIENTRIQQLHEYQLQFMRDEASLLDERVSAGRIVEGHGDLRAEHICLLTEPVIFDCLEFNDRLRLVDPVDELSFLALECERLGNQRIGTLLFEMYSEFTGDHPPGNLLAFYKVYRACIWARLAIWRTRELKRAAWSKWTDRAEAYLRIAEKYAVQTGSG
jgi:uncharacterized protein